MINKLRRRPGLTQSLEAAASRQDEAAFHRLDAAVRESRYSEVIRDSFRHAVEALNADESLIMLSLFKDGLQRSEVAARFGVHPSTISHHRSSICAKLRREFVSCLELKHHLSGAAVEECLSEAVSNPSHSILSLLEARRTD
jgi:RNA polymerase sigma factor (sigma-70 family)